MTGYNWFTQRGDSSIEEVDNFYSRTRSNYGRRQLRHILDDEGEAIEIEPFDKCPASPRKSSHKKAGRCEGSVIVPTPYAHRHGNLHLHFNQFLFKFGYTRGA